MDSNMVDLMGEVGHKPGQAMELDTLYRRTLGEEDRVEEHYIHH